MFRTRAAATFAAAGALVMSGGLVVMNASQAAADPTQVWVCKFVAQPDEQANAAHIEHVNPSSLGKGFTAEYLDNSQFPFAFADKQGKSVAIQWVTNESSEPALSSCPGEQQITGTVYSEGAPDCDAMTVEQFSQPWTQEWVFTPGSDGGSWALGEKVFGTQGSTGTRVATAEECPSQQVVDACDNLTGDQPVGFECVKQALSGSVESEGAPDCDAMTVEQFSQPWTQEWVFTPGEDGGSWSLGEKVFDSKVSTGTRPARRGVPRRRGRGRAATRGRVDLGVPALPDGDPGDLQGAGIARHPGSARGGAGDADRCGPG